MYTTAAEDDCCWYNGKLYQELVKLGVVEAKAWSVATDAAALGLSLEEVLKGYQNPIPPKKHGKEPTPSRNDKKKCVQVPARGSSLPAKEEEAFRKVHTDLFRSGDPILRDLGAQMKNITDFYSASLTVVGCVGRKFAEGLAGWTLVEHFPDQYPSMDVLRGYDEDGELHMMLGARLRALGGVLPYEVNRDLRRLQQLGNRECHDNDRGHRLQDAQKLEVVQAVSRLGSAALDGRLGRYPKAEERLCKYYASQGTCKFGNECHFKHGTKCKFNHMCGGCTNENCKYVHVAECQLQEECTEDCCLFDHTRKPAGCAGKGGKGTSGKGKAKGWQA
jgi:hypothetical protein